MGIIWTVFEKYEIFIETSRELNKPGTAQVGAISKARKDSKTETTFSTTGDNKISQKSKNGVKNLRIFFSKFF